MQPYFFPYLGYYQLVNTVDKFIFYDDVNYIKGGFVNRNNILTRNGRLLITVPVKARSSFKKINELDYDKKKCKKIIKTVEQAYNKSPYFDEVNSLIIKVFNESESLSQLCINSVVRVFEYLDIEKDFTISSKLSYDRSKEAKEKIFDICKLMKSSDYVNSTGGQGLYNKEEFKDNGINLSFIEKNKINYEQFNNKGEFIDNLSIIDLLMNLKKEEVKALLLECNYI